MATVILSHISLRALVLIACAIALCGCLGARTEIEINENGSGTINFSYRVSKLVAHLGVDDDDGRLIALPLTEKDFTGAIENVPGAGLQRFSLNRETEDIRVDAEISFDSLETLQALFIDLNGPALDYEIDTDGSTRLTLRLYEGLENPADESISEMVSSLFADYELLWTISAPGPIASAGSGSIDGRTASVSFTTSEVVLSTDPIVWQVDW